MSRSAQSFYVGEQGQQYAAETLVTGDNEQVVISRERARKLSRYIGQEDTVLEIGVGIGTNLRSLECAERCGYDIGDYGAEACEAAGIRFHTDLEEIADASFTVALFHHSLEHMPNPDDVLPAIVRKVVPGGRVLVFVPKERCTSYRANEPDHHLYSWTPQTLGNLLTALGLSVERVHTGPYGYEKRFASLGSSSTVLYRGALFLTRLLRPVREVIAVARRPVDAREEE